MTSIRIGSSDWLGSVFFSRSGGVRGREFDSGLVSGLFELRRQAGKSLWVICLDNATPPKDGLSATHADHHGAISADSLWFGFCIIRILLGAWLRGFDIGSILPNAQTDLPGCLARSVLLGARSVTSNRVRSSALLGSVFISFCSTTASRLDP